MATVALLVGGVKGLLSVPMHNYYFKEDKPSSFTTAWLVVTKYLQTTIKNYRQAWQSARNQKITRRVLTQHLFCNQFHLLTTNSLQFVGKYAFFLSNQ